MGAEGRFKEGWGGEVDGTDMEGERYTNISERGKIDNGPATRENDRTKEGYSRRYVCLDRRANRQTDKQIGMLTSGYCSTRQSKRQVEGGTDRRTEGGTQDRQRDRQTEGRQTERQTWMQLLFPQNTQIEWIHAHRTARAKDRETEGGTDRTTGKQMDR